MNYYEFYSEDRLTNDDFKEMLSNFYMPADEKKGKEVYPFFEKELYSEIKSYY